MLQGFPKLFSLCFPKCMLSAVPSQLLREWMRGRMFPATRQEVERSQFLPQGCPSAAGCLAQVPFTVLESSTRPAPTSGDSIRCQCLARLAGSEESFGHLRASVSAVNKKPLVFIWQNCIHRKEIASHTSWDKVGNLLPLFHKATCCSDGSWQDHSVPGAGVCCFLDTLLHGPADDAQKLEASEARAAGCTSYK